MALSSFLARRRTQLVVTEADRFARAGSPRYFLRGIDLSLKVRGRVAGDKSWNR